MAEASWGTKRTCPNCGERFYDLGKEDPVVCINCANEWVPEPILKTKQPIIAEEAAKKDKDQNEDDLVEGDDIDISDDDDVIGDISLDDDDDEDVAGMVDTSLSDDD